MAESFGARKAELPPHSTVSTPYRALCTSAMARIVKPAFKTGIYFPPKNSASSSFRAYLSTDAFGQFTVRRENQGNYTLHTKG